jgi:hypothetical protein
MINVEVRLLTDRDAAAYWNLRLETLEQEPASFAESAEEPTLADSPTCEIAAGRREGITRSG